MSSIYRRGKALYFRIKVGDGWRAIRSEFRVGQERAAEAMLRRLETQLAMTGSIAALPVDTVARFAPVWLKTREAQYSTWKNDEVVMRLHVLPTLGAMKLIDVRPSHIVALVRAWRERSGDARMAPKTVYNAYSSLQAFFRDACLEDIIPSSPCVLTKRQLGPKVDGDAEWRPTALFGRVELERLISDDSLSLDHRVMYSLQGIGGLRHGEAAGLLWRNVHLEHENDVLGMLFVAYQYARPLPKGDACRPVPIHPTLASVLADWKLAGWAQMMGRQPTPDDLVLPLPPGAKSKGGPCRPKGFTYDRFVRDLKTLGLRHRRGHDLRRTMISLARSNGASKDILRRATHRPPKEVIEGYTTFEWEAVCREVAKLPIARTKVGKIIEISGSLAAGAEGLVTALVTTGVSPANSLGEASGPPRTRMPPVERR